MTDTNEVVCVLFCFAFFLQKIKDDKMKDERERKKERSRDWVCVGVFGPVKRGRVFLNMFFFIFIFIFFIRRFA